MTRIALGPTSQKTVDDDVFVKTAELARRYKGVRLHTHLAENQVRHPCVPTSSATEQARFAEHVMLWRLDSASMKWSVRAIQQQAIAMSALIVQLRSE